jgi:hypothetical protein
MTLSESSGSSRQLFIGYGDVYNGFEDALGVGSGMTRASLTLTTITKSGKVPTASPVM